MRFKKQIIILSTFLLLLLPFGVSADGLVPCGGPTESPCTVKDIFVLVARVTNTLIGLAGIYAVYVIIGAGFWMTVTMGNEEAITKNKKALTQAVVGFVLAMMAYMMVNTTVNYILLEAATNEKCKIDLSDPLNYLIIHSDATKHASCNK